MACRTIWTVAASRWNSGSGSRQCTTISTRRSAVMSSCSVRGWPVSARRAPPRKAEQRSCCSKRQTARAGVPVILRSSDRSRRKNGGAKTKPAISRRSSTGICGISAGEPTIAPSSIGHITTARRSTGSWRGRRRSMCRKPPTSRCPRTARIGCIRTVSRFLSKDGSLPTNTSGRIP